MSGVNAIKVFSTLTVRGTRGNDQIAIENTADGKLNVSVNGATQTYSGVKNVVVLAGAGDDFVEVAKGTTARVALMGGSGNDQLRNRAEWSAVFGGSGSDVISNHADKALVMGNRGSDTIQNFGDRDLVHGGFGTDHLKNFGTSTVAMGSWGADKIENFEDAIVSGGAGNDKLRNYGEDSVVLGMTGKDDLRNTQNGSYLNGGWNRDTVTTRGDDVTVRNTFGWDVVAKNDVR